MKAKHIISIGLIMFWLVGCGNNQDEWQELSSHLRFTSPRSEVCRHRVARIAKQMILQGKPFDLVFGYPNYDRKTEHVRIEYWKGGDLVILDPMWKTRNLHKFVETDRWAYAPFRDANIRVISYVNRVLNEIGVEPCR